MKGDSKKFQYILPDSTTEIVEIDGDEFAECDYGILIDGSPESERLSESIKELARFAMQNQTLNFSTIMKVLSSPSMAEIQRTIERGEREVQEAAQEKIKADRENVEAQLAAELQAKQEENAIKLADIEARDIMNQRDNEVKLLIANISASYEDGIQEGGTEKAALYEQIRQFNEELNFKKAKQKEDAEIKRAALRNRPKTSK